MAARAQARLAELGQHGQQLGVLAHREVERRVCAAALERHHVVRLACAAPAKVGDTQAAGPAATLRMPAQAQPVQAMKYNGMQHQDR